jgi:hypothetical protein
MKNSECECRGAGKRISGAAASSPMPVTGGVFPPFFRQQVLTGRPLRLRRLGLASIIIDSSSGLYKAIIVISTANSGAFIRKNPSPNLVILPRKMPQMNININVAPTLGSQESIRHGPFSGKHKYPLYWFHGPFWFHHPLLLPYTLFWSKSQQ